MRKLELFSSRRNFWSHLTIVAWGIFGKPLVELPLLPGFARKPLFKLWGAKIGQGLVLRKRVKVQFPWNLEIGDNCWIGEEVWFINHEKVKIGSNVCISQRSIICSGRHDFRSSSLEYAHKPIEIYDGAWVCLDAKVLPGVSIGKCSVVSAGEIARKSIPDYSMLIAGEIRAIDPPK